MPSMKRMQSWTKDEAEGDYETRFLALNIRINKTLTYLNALRRSGCNKTLYQCILLSRQAYCLRTLKVLYISEQ